jgi:hypothetical protein
MSRKDKQEVRQAIDDLQESTPDAAERWIKSLVAKLPEKDRKTRVVESVEGGECIYENPDALVREADGIIEIYEGANAPAPPDEWTHVATGPEGISSGMVHTWRLYVDLETHTPPGSIDVTTFPVEVWISHKAAFAP